VAAVQEILILVQVAMENLQVLLQHQARLEAAVVDCLALQAEPMVD
jgi:hypothetical protein